MAIEATEIRKFLQALDDAGGSATLRGMPGGSSQEQNDARQACCRRGLARFGAFGMAVASMWHLTQPGKAWLATLEGRES